MPVLTVALTGGIATGKSLVAAVLRRRGCHVESADLVARGLLSPGRKAWREVVKHFGPSILSSDRSINRTKLAAIVFSDPAERRFLDSLIHPLVMAEKKKTVRRLAKAGRRRIYVSEAALTLEAGYDGFFDRIIVTDCPRPLQIRRLMARGRLGRRDALRRVRAQLPRRAKLRMADYIIDTAGTPEQTIARAEEVAVRLREDSRRRQRGETFRRDKRARIRIGGRRPGAGP